MVVCNAFSEFPDILTKNSENLRKTPFKSGLNVVDLMNNFSVDVDRRLRLI